MREFTRRATGRTWAWAAVAVIAMVLTPSRPVVRAQAQPRRRPPPDARTRFPISPASGTARPRPAGQQRDGALGQGQLPGAERAGARLPEGVRRGAGAEVRLPAGDLAGDSVRPLLHGGHAVARPRAVPLREGRPAAHRLAGRPQADGEGLWLQGFSVGRYEGDALIVDTDHFVFDITGFDDYNGIPSSQLKKVHERYWREGTELKVTMTVEDPMFLRKPASYTTRWLPQRRATSSSLGLRSGDVARAGEDDAAEVQGIGRPREEADDERSTMDGDGRAGVSRRRCSRPCPLIAHHSSAPFYDATKRVEAQGAVTSSCSGTRTRSSTSTPTKRQEGRVAGRARRGGVA